MDIALIVVLAIIAIVLMCILSEVRAKPIDKEPGD